MNLRVASLYHDDDARWRAFLDRDPAADGLFYVAVRTTGVYCRPTCPARRPKREHVTFFADPQKAEAAGYRPCRRCRPHQVSDHQRLVARAMALLETADPAPSLADLAAELGVTPHQLQRVFQRATGLTPHAYANELRAARLRGLLREGRPVTWALYEAGYASSRALYERAREQLGMTPGSYRSGGRGQRIAFGCFPSPVGPMLIAATAHGLCALHLGEGDLVATLRDEFPAAQLVQAPDEVAPLARAVLAYLSGETRSLDLPIDVEGTAFQRRVWEALRTIPYGETRTYADVARMIGRPTAVRAVARACAANPVALVIPCHRMVGAGGDLRGYRWGVDRKRRFLELEQGWDAPDRAALQRV